MASLAGNVCNEHIRKLLHDRVVISTSSDGDGSTVHVHLAVADLVKPRPSECVLTVGHAFGKRVLEDSSASALRILVEVAGNVRGTAANDAVDDFPLAVLGGLLVQGHRDLA